MSISSTRETQNLWTFDQKKNLNIKHTKHIQIGEAYKIVKKHKPIMYSFKMWYN